MRLMLRDSGVDSAGFDACTDEQAAGDGVGFSNSTLALKILNMS